MCNRISFQHIQNMTSFLLPYSLASVLLASVDNLERQYSSKRSQSQCASTMELTARSISINCVEVSLSDFYAILKLASNLAIDKMCSAVSKLRRFPKRLEHIHVVIVIYMLQTDLLPLAHFNHTYKYNTYTYLYWCSLTPHQITSLS